jgi:serine/threonine protein kinase
MIRRFAREASNMVGLKHRNIVEFYCFGSAHDTFFFVMEYCSGGSLGSYLDTRGGRLPISHAVNIAIQILDGLDYAHNAEIVSAKDEQDEFVTSRGLVHRNLGPDHILFHGTGGVHFAKIGDYSLARAFDATGLSGHSYSKLLIVKPQFHSKRQVLDFRHPKPEDDVWAAAAILYRMIVGHTPRDFDGQMDVWQTVLQTAPVPIHRRDSSVPAPLAQVIDYALDDRKELHFKTAAELKTALQSVL